MSKDSQYAALQGYLDALLTDSEPASEANYEFVAEPSYALVSGHDSELAPELRSESAADHAKPAPLLEKPRLELNLPRVALREPLISDEQISKLPVSISIQEVQEVQDDVLLQTSAVAADNVLTTGKWADSAFECLLFDVAGLTLAVPLVALGSIYSFKPDELTPIFAQPDWFIGLLPAQDTHLKVLETARWVMPERYTADMRNDLKYVLSINGYDWGLAVNHVRKSIRLQPGDVKWRTQRGKRAWLAGTVIEHMCALLDVEVLAQLITGKNVPHSTA